VKALTLWQPWASLVALGVKTIETRSWSTSYRGPLAIHAAKTDLHLNVKRCDGADHGRALAAAVKANGFARLPLGAIVATCKLVDVVPFVHVSETRGGRPGFPAVTVAHLRDGRWTAVVHDGTGWTAAVDEQALYGDFTPGRFAWLLSDVQALDEPVPATGHQGLWEWAP
jgi:hypothetical protein